MSAAPDGRREPRPAKLLLGLAVLALGRVLRRRRPAEDATQSPRPPVGGSPCPPQDPRDPRQRLLPDSRRSELALVCLLLGCAGAFVGFIAAYALDPHDNQLLGLGAGAGLLTLAGAAITAGLRVVPQETSSEPRPPLPDPPAEHEVIEIIHAGGEGISRRGLIAGAGGAAGIAALAAAATPLSSLGPGLSGVHRTPWRRGVRMVDEQGSPYAASEIEIGSFYTALPEGGDWESIGAGLLVVKLPPSLISLPAPRRTWAPQGILAYSKICPHAGCAISLYRYPLYAPTSDAIPAFTCPCHYSTFAPGEGGRLIFGPAGRSLPQLPVMIDDAGHLRAAGAFDEDVGPAWWGLRRGET
jgi:ubiquinol-cytochrome c reductase iron-sulfur subunit